MEFRTLATLLIASSNAGKLLEFRALVPAGIDVIGLNDAEVRLPSEDGNSFLEIAAVKALVAARQSGMLSLADDSGLEVAYLQGAPGVRSARFAGEPANAAANRRALLKALSGVPPDQREARFVCAVALATPAGIAATGVGTWGGAILDRERGERGFGYDSLFVLADGRTVAELLDVEKNALSHRARAFKQILPRLLSIIAGPDDSNSHPR
jgi:XTP/dITP diphosphohydrolase